MSNDNLSAGSIMLDRLGNSIAIIKGKKPSVINLEPISDSALPYILIESFGGKYRQFTDDATCKRAYEDDVLLVWDGERAGLSSYGHSGYIGSTLAAIRVKDTKLKPNYLFRIFEKEREWLRGNSEGTGVPHLSRWAVENIIYFKPPLPEQQKIATILSSVDDVIEKTRAQIDKLKGLKTGMMQELLTKGIGHTEFKNSSLGVIPSSWDVVELGVVGKLERGKFSHRPRNDPKFYGGNIPFLQTGDIPKKEPAITQFSQTLNESGLKVSKLFPAGTLVITIAATIGEIGILEFDSCFPDSLVGITVNQQKANSLFVLYVMRYLKSELEKLAPQTAQKNINLDILQPFQIPLPSLEEQELIASSMSSVDARLDLLHQKLKRTQSTKKALMQDLLTGKVRVKLTDLDTEAAS